MMWPIVWTFIKMSPNKNTQQPSKPQPSKPQTSNMTSEDIYRLLII